MHVWVKLIFSLWVLSPASKDTRAAGAHPLSSTLFDERAKLKLSEASRGQRIRQLPILVRWNSLGKKGANGIKAY